MNLKHISIIILALFLVSMSIPLSPAYSSSNEDTKITVAVDLAHGESDKYLSYIMGNITFVNWKVIDTPITAEVLADVDVLILGQPTSGLSPDELGALQEWLSQGNKVLWVAGDSDYGGGPSSQQACNDLLEFIGAKLRLELAAVYDDIHNAGAFYRVLTRMMPDNVPELYTDLLTANINKPILMHGPDAVIWVDENGEPHDPVNETFDGLIRIVWSYDTAYIGDNNPPLPLVYNPLFYGQGTGNHTFVMVAAEYWKDNNNLIVVSGESPYGDYEPMFAWEYYNVTLDGPQFLKNMIRWFVYLITIGPVPRITVAVDLAHGESDKYLSYIMGNITFADWKIIDTTITSDVLSDVDVLILGQPTSGLAPDELGALQEWLSQGNKVLWVAGDSDYGGGPSSQQACNDLLEFIGAKLRLELAAVYDDIHNAGAFYRVLTRMMPDNVPELYTDLLTANINKPILMHGPDAVIWVDENGEPHDPVNETFDGLIRIVWSYDTAYIGDNNPPLPLVYNPLFYGQGTGNHTFVMVAAEYWKDNNNLIVVSGESPYGDYEPMFAWEYYNVTLDGPQFLKNMIRWFAINIGKAPAAPELTLIGEIDDPEGDDNGIGTVEYPTNSVFQPGVFDLVKFGVYEDGENIYLKVTVKDLGDNPWGGANGFCLQYVHVYIKTTDTSLPLNETTFGLNVTVWHGWNYAVLMAPGWGEDPVPSGEKSAIYLADGSLVAVEEKDPGFDVYVDSQLPNTIVAKISKSLLSDVDNIQNWVFVVAVTGYDGFGPMKVRTILTETTEWNFGGADPLAVLAGVMPQVIDLLAPTPEDQYKLLKSYDAENKVPAKIAGVKLSTGELVLPEALTVTVTVTEEVTQTITETTTQTVTETETITETTTVKETSTTTTITTSTITEVQTDWTMAIVLAIIGLIIGFIIAWFAKK